MSTDVRLKRGCGVSAQAEGLESRLLLSAISGAVWEDLDGDGLRDVGEVGLSGWTVYIDGDKNGQRDAGESYQVTGGDGSYVFTGLAPGSYWVTEEAPAGWVQSYPDLPSAPRTFTNVNAGLPGVYESSIDWGDYDGDGDLDLAVLGKTSEEAITLIYRNDDMIFSDSGITLPALRNGALAWGDYDDDGWVDLIVTGIDRTFRKAEIYHNNNGSLVLAGATLTDVDNSSVAWGDYDGDGDLDLVVTGFDGTAADASIYRNDGGSFVNIAAGLPGVHHADAAWGDYDGDGDLDLLLAGRTTDSQTLSRIYRNDNGTFLDIAAGLTGVDHCAIAWGDFNGDTRPDIILTGNSSAGRVSIVYRNDGGGMFTDIEADLPGVSGSAVAWGDYDLDGRLDLALTGYGGSDVGRISRVYRNDGEAGFTDAQVGLMGVNGSSLAWDDVDADGYPDIALSGLSGTTSVVPVTQVYRNVALPGPHMVLLGGSDVGDTDFGNYQPCTIGGTKWHDFNGNGVWDDGEDGLQNWKFYLDANNNGELDAWEPSALSGSGGQFAFHLLAPGPYIVREVAKAGWMLDVPAEGYVQVDLISGETVSDLTFNGWQPAQIGGSFWDDGNGDGMWDDGEAALVGWKVYLDTDGDGDGEMDPGEARRITDSYGAYAFEDLSPGSFVVRAVAEEGWAQSAPPDGYYTRTMVSGQVDDTATFGFYLPGAIAGIVWNDEDTDGVRDAEELPQEGWQVFLDADGDGTLDAIESYQVTDADGAYTFTGLVPGEHTVAEVVQAGWTPVVPDGGHTTIDVVSGQTTENVDFGNRLPEPEIAVLRETTEILDAQVEAVEFGSVREGAPAASVVFTIRNEGDDVMTLGPITAPDGFVVSQPPAPTVAANGGETTFIVDLETAGPGIKSGEISITSDDRDENPFNFPVTGTVLTAPEIQVTLAEVEILDGPAEAVDLGQVAQGDAAAARWTFTVTNLGEDVLTVGAVELTGGAAFEVADQPVGDVLGGETTTFTLALSPDAVGTYQADVRFVNGDADENPFDFPVTATVTNAAPIVDAGEDLTSDEGQGVDLAGGFTDAGEGQTHTVEWDFGDGSTQAGSLTPTHVFADDGEYTVTLTVTDGQGGVGTDTLTVTAGNLPPTAGDDAGSTAEDTPVTFTGAELAGNDTDVPADPLTVSAVTPTDQTHGTVQLIGPDVMYTPAADFHGPASFSYTMDDGDGGTDDATVTITVEPVPDAPVAHDDAFATDMDSPLPALSVLGNDTDGDGDELRVVAHTEPARGTLTDHGDGTFAYSPDAGFTGVDRFTYTVEDSGGLADGATVTITVGQDNIPPSAVDDDVATDEAVPVTTHDLTANDIDANGDALQVVGHTDPGHGTAVDHGDGTFTYTPDPGFHGLDSFTYTIDDGNGGTDTATVNITVARGNTPPSAVDDDVTTDEDIPVTTHDLTANDIDADGDALQVVGHTNPGHGTIVDHGDGTFTYTPDPGFGGLDSFTYTIDDGNGGTDTATVTVTVLPVDLSLALVAHLPFDGNTSDVTGNGHDAAIHGNVSYDEGLFGEAAVFAGSAGDDYVIGPAGIDFPSWQNYSVSAWFMDTGTGEYGGGGARIIDRGGAEAGCSIGITATGAVFYNTYDGAVSVDLGSDAYHAHDYRDFEWHHVGAVKDGSVARLYVDGILVDSRTDLQAIPGAADAVAIGGSLSAEGSHFGGRIDDVRIYDRATSAAEARALANHAGPTFDVELDGAGRPVTYTDTDGTVVRVYLYGGSATLHFAGGAILRTDVGGAAVLTGMNLRLDAMELTGTTAASSLIIISQGGDGLATVGRISGRTPLGLLYGTTIDLIGEGIQMTGAGYAATVYLHDVRNGADIVMPGEDAPAGIAINADRMLDGTDVRLGSHLSVLVASCWRTGELVTPWASTVLVRGNPWTGVRGDFGADVTLTGADWRGYALISLYVTGKITTSRVIAETGMVASVIAGQWDTGLLKARSATVVWMTGNGVDPEIDGRLGADVTLTGTGAGGYSLIHAIVAGHIASDWTLAGSAYVIQAGSTAESWTLTAQKNVVYLGVTGDLAGSISAEYFTTVYAGGALSGEIVAVGADARGISIYNLLAGQVRDTSLTALGGVYWVNVVDWLDTDAVRDTIRANWITVLVTRGQGTLAGDFSVDLILDGADAWGYTLRTALIAGTLASQRWQLASNAGTIYTGQTDDDWQLDTPGFVTYLYGRDSLGGTVDALWIGTARTFGTLRADLTLTGHNAAGTSLGTLMAADVADVRLEAPGAVYLIHVQDWPSGEIRVGSVYALAVVGNGVDSAGTFGADLTITGPAAGNYGLASAWIGGDLTSRLWNITGDVANVRVGAAIKGTAQDPTTLRATGTIFSVVAERFEHADILAGIARNGERHAAVYADFVDISAAIGSIRIVGLAGESDRFFVDTTFSASAFGHLHILNAAVGTGILGLFVRESFDQPEIGSLYYRDTVSGETWYYSSAGEQPFGGPASFIHVIEA